MNHLRVLRAFFSTSDVTLLRTWRFKQAVRVSVPAVMLVWYDHRYHSYVGVFCLRMQPFMVRSVGLYPPCTRLYPLCTRDDSHITVDVGQKRNCTCRRLETLIILIRRRIHKATSPQPNKHASRILVNFYSPRRLRVCCAREVPDLFPPLYSGGSK